MNKKLKELDELLQIVHELRKQRKTIVFTNGCFDVLHKGHFKYLKEAKEIGDVLIVALNSDSSVKKIKGENRPVNNQETRAMNLAKLDCVDYVIIFYEDTPINLLKKIRPNVLVKGGNYTIKGVVGREIVESYGGKVQLAKYVEGYSTTRMIESMKKR